MALLPFHWGYDEVSLFFTWWWAWSVLTCSIGANHCRLRHIGWEKCGHGLTSRPRESASEPFLNEPLGLFRYPPGSGRAFFAGTLPLRYCAARFACKTPTWRLPVPGCVVDLVTASLSLMVVVGRFSGLVVLVQDGKEFDLTEQPLHTSLVSLFNLSHVCGKDCIMWGFEMFLFLITRGRRRDQNDEEYISAQVRTGVG